MRSWWLVRRSEGGDSLSVLGVKLTEIRGGAAVAWGICLAAGIADSSTGHHADLTYALWYGATGGLSLILLLTTAVIVGDRRRSTRADARARNEEVPGSATFRGGSIGGDSMISVRSTADVLAHDMSITDRARMHVEHHPPGRVRPVAGLDSANGSPTSHDEAGNGSGGDAIGRDD